MLFWCNWNEVLWVYGYGRNSIYWLGGKDIPFKDVEIIT